MSSYVVFPKSNVTLAYAIGRDPRVLSATEFEQWAQSMKPTALQSISQYILPNRWLGGFDEAAENNINAEFGRCTTWDEAELEKK